MKLKIKVTQGYMDIGTPCLRRGCAIALAANEALAAAGLDGYYAIVGSQTISIRREIQKPGGTDDKRVSGGLPLPPSAQRFIKQFDDKNIPFESIKPIEFEIEFELPDAEAA